jgi:hypothetical protein
MNINVDRIFETLNRNQVLCLLIGGMNALLRHQQDATLDIDIWVQDKPDNLDRCEKALAMLEAEWGEQEDSWAPVSWRPAGWIRQHRRYNLTTPFGAIDVFRQVMGLAKWDEAYAASIEEKTAAGTPYRGICDSDMLKCQLALLPNDRKAARVEFLQGILGAGGKA